MAFRFNNVGDEIVVNPTFNDSQTNVRVASLAGGGYVVLWDSFQQHGLVAQRYDVNGVAQGSLIFVTSIYLAGRGPSIAGLASDGFVVTWGDGIQGSGAPILRSQIYDASGIAVGSPINGATDPLFGGFWGAHVSSLSSGGFLVVHDRPMRGRIYDSSGVPLGNEFVIDPDGAYTQRNVVAAQLSSGTLAVVWQEGGAYGASNYRVRLFDANGAALAPEQTIGALVANSDFVVPTLSVTALAGGGFVVTFEELTANGSDVKAQLFAADGTKVGGEFLLNTTVAGDQTNPQVVALAGSGFAVGWTDNSGQSMDRNGTAVRLQAFDANGQPVGDEHLVNSGLLGNQYLARIAVLTDGSLLLSWAGDTGTGSSGIRTQVVSLATVNELAGTPTGETINGGAGPDDISGLDGNDVLNGGAGRDILLGGVGDDQLNGGIGDDRLEGGDGMDQLDGGAGHDILLGGIGNDLLNATDSDDLLDGGDGDDVLNANGTGRFRLFGGAGNDQIALTGTMFSLQVGPGSPSPAILISAGDGADTLTLNASIAGSINVDLGDGADTVILGSTYQYDSSAMPFLQFSDFAAGAGGDVLNVASFLPSRVYDWDGVTNPFITGHLELVQVGTAVQLLYRGRLEFGGTLLATFNATTATAFVAANFAGLDPQAPQPPGLTINGTPDPDTLQGSHGGDIISGLASNDTIRGGAGNDVIDGGDGDDFISGEVGNDTLVTSNGVDNIYGGDGDDQITVLAGLSGPDYINTGYGYDVVELLGAVPGTQIYGGPDARLIADASNLLPAGSPFIVDLAGVGFGGQASILGMQVGGFGTYEITGGSGNDIFTASNQFSGVNRLVAWGDTGDDTIVGGRYSDQIYGGDGNDNLRGVAFGASFDGGDLVDGGAGNDIIDGGSGNDVLTGGEGDDQLFGSDDNDQLNGGDGNDALNGGQGGDTLFGGYGNDTLNGGAASDTMLGGAGNDSYFVDSGDVVIDGAGGGYDIIYATGNFTLGTGQEIEVLGTLDNTATTFLILSGNELNNYLTGNAGTNVMYGGAGQDYLQGRGGDDSYYVDGSDIVLENAGEGYDIIYTSSDLSLPTDSEVEVLATIDNTATTAITLRGNQLNNYLTGNAGANLLIGEGGSDYLGGRGGNDSYYVDSGDTVLENVGEGYDIVYAMQSFALHAGTEVEVLATIDDGATTAIDLTGNELANYLSGNEGTNTLNGGGGSDYLAGRGGNDIFAFGAACGADVITDFVRGQDRIDLSALGLTFAQVQASYAQAGADGIISLGGGNSVTLLGVTLADLTVADFILGAAAEAPAKAGSSNDTLDLAKIFEGDNEMNDLSGASASPEGDAAEIVGTPGADVLTGTDAADTITGLTGDDDINGGLGNDIIYGNEGDDFLGGGDGDDILYGGDGNDFISGGDGNDIIYSGSSGPSGGRHPFSMIRGGEGDDIIYGGAGPGQNIEGGRGNDQLFGGSGNNALQGGPGDDIYYVVSGNNVLELGFEGYDIVYASTSFVLGDGSVEVLATIDADATTPINLTGGDSSNNYITGNAGPNILDGRGGTDVLWGRGGDDTYVVDASDGVIEYTGDGYDTIKARGNYILPDGAYVERLMFANATGFGSLTGNSQDNLLVGNAGNNTLIGGGGNDTLEGGTGNDTLRGDGGNDSYFVDSGDIITELVGEGYDFVYASTSFVLTVGAEIELLGTVDETSTIAIDLTGNNFNNYITGNAGTNVLNGGGGSDYLWGRGGDDIYFVDSDDAIIEYAGDGYDFAYASSNFTLGAGVEIEILGTIDQAATTAINLTGNELNNYLVGNAGANVLNGDAGSDYLAGRGGNDSYYVDGSDAVFEYLGEGHDIVYSAGNFALGAGVEVEILATTDNLATTAIDLTGNELSNYLVGNAGGNKLNGAAGADYLSGRGGDDIFVFGAASGADVITDFVRGQDRIDLSALGLTFAQVQAGYTQAGADGIISLGGGNSVTLLGVTLADLTAADFILSAAAEAPSKGSSSDTIDAAKLFDSGDLGQVEGFAAPYFSGSSLDAMATTLQADVLV